LCSLGLGTARKKVMLTSSVRGFSSAVLDSQLSVANLLSQCLSASPLVPLLAKRGRRACCRQQWVRFRRAAIIAHRLLALFRADMFGKKKDGDKEADKAKDSDKSKSKADSKGEDEQSSLKIYRTFRAALLFWWSDFARSSVLEGAHMPSMDSNGKSDPYCSCFFYNTTVKWLALLAYFLTIAVLSDQGEGA
jgi:hypothetical protein